MSVKWEVMQDVDSESEECICKNADFLVVLRKRRSDGIVITDRWGQKKAHAVTI